MMDPDQETESLCNLPFIPITDFIIMKNNLGHGSYGQVKKAIWQGKDVAIKSMFPSNTSTDNFRREAEQLSRVKHDNIINVYGWTKLDNDLGLIMEFADCGNLYDFLHNDNAAYTLSHAISWCLQCANGVRYLHSLNIIHRDLKPSNLLLTNKCRTIKLCDFGTARDKKTSMSIQQGTPSWMAPEVFRSRNYSEKCDVFSFGIILWEVFTRKIPFENYQQQFALMWAINKGTRPPRIRGCPLILRDLIDNCWNSNQHIRPSMDKVVKIMEKLHELIPNESDNPIELSPKAIYRIQITNVSNSDSLKLKNNMTNTRTSADDHFLAPRDSTRSNLGHKRSNSTDASLIIGTDIKEKQVNEEDIQELFRHFNAYLFLRKEFYPLEPEIKDTKSMMIFEEHKKLALELFRLSRSNEHLQNRLQELEKKRNQTPRDYDDYADYLNLKNENRDLLKARSEFAKELMELNENSIPYQRNDDEWILVDHSPLGSKTKHS